MCIRIAIELGIHRCRGTDLESDQEEQLKRRVFWDCYHLDRVSSSTLGRPFGIADADISVALPADSLGDGGSQLQPEPAISLANHITRLMQEESAIRTALLQPAGTATTSRSWTHAPEHSGAEHMLNRFQIHSNRLHSWWSRRPFTGFDQGVYERPEYFDFLYRRKKLDLTRAILSQAWKSHVRSKELLRGCLRTALSVISLFNGLRTNNVLTSTRGFIHLVFSTGLSIITTCQELLRGADTFDSMEWHSDIELLWAGLFQDTPTYLSPAEVVEGLSLALESLNAMSSYVPDTLQYTAAFRSLKSKFEIHLANAGIERTAAAINTKGDASGDERLGFGEMNSNTIQLPDMSNNATMNYLPDEPSTQGIQMPDHLPLPAEETGIDDLNTGDLSFPAIPGGLDPWFGMPPMDQLSFDLLDYTWEAPVLWQDGSGV